jgi:hypothetical protein
MKNILKVALVAVGIFSFAQSQAKTMQRDTTVGQKINHTAKKVGHATAHAGASTAAMVVDKKYDGKCGPGGETVYINKHDHYYYINKSGHRVYVRKSQLMDKKM